MHILLSGRLSNRRMCNPSTARRRGRRADSVAITEVPDGFRPYGLLVDRFLAIGELPVLHAVAIRLQDEGVDGRVIAAALAIAQEDLPILLEIAEAKLRRLEATEFTPWPAADWSGLSSDRQFGRERNGRSRNATPATTKQTSANPSNQGDTNK
jgi:hypothetical protein